MHPNARQLLVDQSWLKNTIAQTIGTVMMARITEQGEPMNFARKDCRFGFFIFVFLVNFN